MTDGIENKTQKNWILLLFPFIVIGPLGMDIYLPSLPAIGKVMATTDERVQLTLSAYVGAFGIGQLFFGPVCDHFGRKKVLILGPLFYFLASLLCLLASSIEVFIFLRSLQGIIASSAHVAVFAVVRDLSSGSQAAKMLSFIGGGVALTPVLAPMIGSFFQTYYGWEANFIFLAAFSFCLVFLAIFKIQETKKEDTKSEANGNLLQQYLHILRNNSFLYNSTIRTLSFSCLILFFSLSSEIFILTLGLNPFIFSVLFGSNALILLAANFISGKLVGPMGPIKTLLLGISFLLIGSLSMVAAVSFIKPFSFWVISIPMGVTSLGIAMTIGPAMAGVLSPFPTMAGKAAGLNGGLNFILAAVITSLLTHLPLKAHYTLPWSLFTFSVLIFLLWNRLDKEASYF